MKAPIICGREPTATEEEKKLGAERSAELSAKVNQVICSIWHVNYRSKLYCLMWVRVVSASFITTLVIEDEVCAWY